MPDSTLKSVSLTSIVDLDCAVAAQLNSAITSGNQSITESTAQKSLLKRFRAGIQIFQFTRVGMPHANQTPASDAMEAEQRRGRETGCYPLTCILENARMARPAVGRPKLVAGRKVAKISMFFNSDSTSPPFSPPESTR